MKKLKRDQGEKLLVDVFLELSYQGYDAMLAAFQPEDFRSMRQVCRLFRSKMDPLVNRLDARVSTDAKDGPNFSDLTSLLQRLQGLQVAGFTLMPSDSASEDAHKVVQQLVDTVSTAACGGLKELRITAPVDMLTRTDFGALRQQQPASSLHHLALTSTDKWLLETEFVQRLLAELPTSVTSLTLGSSADITVTKHEQLELLLTRATAGLIIEPLSLWSGGLTHRLCRLQVAAGGADVVLSRYTCRVGSLLSFQTGGVDLPTLHMLRDFLKRRRRVTIETLIWTRGSSEWLPITRSLLADPRVTLQDVNVSGKDSISTARELQVMVQRFPRLPESVYFECLESPRPESASLHSL